MSEEYGHVVGSKTPPPAESRDLEAALTLAILWIQTGAQVRPEGYAFAPAPAPVGEPEAPRPTPEATTQTR